MRIASSMVMTEVDVLLRSPVWTVVSYLASPAATVDHVRAVRFAV